MFNFNLQQTNIHQAVKIEPIFRIAGIFKKLFFVFFVFGLLLIFLGFSPNFSIIFLILFLVCQIKESFFNQKLKNPKLKASLKEVIKNPEQYNLAEFLSFETARAVSKSVKFIKKKKISGLNSSVLFYFVLSDEPKLNFIFSKAILSIKEIKKILKNQIGESSQSDFQKVIFEALKIASEKCHQRIEVSDVALSLAKHNPIFREVLIKNNLQFEDIENIINWRERIEQKIARRKKFWEYKNLVKMGSIAKDWASGYTTTLDKYSTDWTTAIKKHGFSETIAHAKELETAERILSRRRHNNVLIVGQPGSGRKGIIYGLTERCVSGQSLPQINYKRVKELNLSSLLAKISDSEKVEATLDKIFQETAAAGNVILVIDEFHNYIGAKTKPGVIDISGVISSYLHLPQFQIIAVTSFAGLHKVIEQNPSILNLFGKVEVSEVSKENTLMILESLAPALENKYKIFITYPSIKNIVFYTDRYISDVPFPKKAIDILDEVAVYVSAKKKKIVRAEDVAKIITEKAEIPVGEIKAKEKDILLNLESLVHKRIINQEKAVKELSSAMRRAKAEISIRKGPIGAFLFLGPTGVGKTETAKALNAIYFGSEKKMIRLDMSEFQNTSDIPRLLGSPGEEGFLTTQVRENPFSLVLLDELEKAHSNILNLFLQVLDEGHLTDGLGRKVSFKNAIIIATSNAGYKVILEALKRKTEWSLVKQKLLDFLFEKAIFRPEFINRFDSVVVFKPLSKKNLLAIAELMLNKLKKNLKEKGIEFVITNALKEKIVELGYSPIFGAREMRRVIQDKIENVLAKALLSGELKRGERAEIDPQTFQII